MNNLNINQINIGGQSVTTIDSREVAEMLGKEHKYVLRDIEGTDDVVGIIPTLIGANLHSSKYFIESSYKDARNRIQKCYLVTKMGCELLGNKQQGEKGILFTAKYVERFNQMEQTIKNPVPQMQNLDLANQMMNIAQGTYQMGQVVQRILQSIGTIQTYVQDSIQAKDHQIDKAMSLIGLRSKNVSSLISKLKEELYKRNGIVVQANDIEYLKAKNKIFKEFTVTKWEEIPIGKYNAVHSFIEIMFDFD
ncbi:MAG: Rha family transcriptional regulator [Clostridium sp.]|nr:Rha family transcriptional regulator [Clostridium celatum]MDU6341152.1 Rha family transcriptional regulator [Clostridium sp.]